MSGSEDEGDYENFEPFEDFEPFHESCIEKSKNNDEEPENSMNSNSNFEIKRNIRSGQKNKRFDEFDSIISEEESVTSGSEYLPSDDEQSDCSIESGYSEVSILKYNRNMSNKKNTPSDESGFSDTDEFPNQAKRLNVDQALGLNNQTPNLRCSNSIDKNNVSLKVKVSPIISSARNSEISSEKDTESAKGYDFEIKNAQVLKNPVCELEFDISSDEETGHTPLYYAVHNRSPVKITSQKEANKKSYEKKFKNKTKALQVSEQVANEIQSSMVEVPSSENNEHQSVNNIKVSNQNIHDSSDISGFSSLNNSLNINLKSVGQALKNKKEEVVLASSEGCKKYCCYYCVKYSLDNEKKNMRILYTKLPEHYVSKHEKEKTVIKLERWKKLIDKLKKKPNPDNKVMLSDLVNKRKRILNLLRIKANHLNNLNAENGSHYVVRRRPNKKGKVISNFEPCYNCTQVYSESSLRKHVKNCTGMSFKKKHVIKSRARATNGDYHEIASELAIKLICKMRETKAVDQIRFDSAMFVWLNAEATRTETKPQTHARIRANISRLGTLMNLIKQNNENIEELRDLFDEDYYKDFIEAVRIMGKPHPDTAFMQSPATANDMFNLITNVAEIYEVSLGAKNEKERLKVQNFLRKLKKLWHYDIGSTILETQARIRRNKIIDLPTDSDTVKLNEYLQKKMSESLDELKKSYSDFEYEKLRNATVCYLQSMNARRPGEVERMELEDYKHIRTDGKDCLIVPRGKRRRGVPIVFDINEKCYLDMLLSCRQSAQIYEKNPYMFATIHDVSSKDFGYVSACQLLSKFAEQCEAEHPETLRGTFIRMKVATEGLAKGLPEPEVQKLADYLGHTPNIHKLNYRQAVFNTDVAVSKQVRAAQGLATDYKNPDEKTPEKSHNVPIEVKNFSNNYTRSNMHIDQSVDQSSRTEQNEENNSDTITKRGSLAATKSRPARLSWRQPQIDILLAHFPNALNLKYKVPSSKEINNFIKTTKDPILQMRTDGQIRSWMHIQRNEKKDGKELPERDTVPSYIYSSFEKYITAGKVPSHTKCGSFLAKSPSKSSVTISNIQNWVQLAIRQRSKTKNRIKIK